MTRRHVAIVDPTVAALLGHPLPQAAALLAAFARQGDSCSIVTHCALPANTALPETHIVRHFSLSPFETNLGFGSSDGVRSVAPILTAELASLLRRTGSTPCHFVLPTVNTVMAVALADLFRKHAAATTRADHVFSLMLANECGLRLDDRDGLVEFDPAVAGRWRAALQTLAASGQVHLFVVSEEMAAIYSALASAPLGVVPPFHSARVPPDRSPGNEARPRISLFAGQATHKKNFTAVPDIARQLLQRQAGAELLAQIHYCTTPELANAAAALRHMASENATLKVVEGFLPDAELARVFLSCDIALLGYSAEEYAGKTSGFLWDAIASGQIVVTPANTWLSRECAHYGMPCLTYPDGDLAAAVAALETAVLRLPELRPHAFAAARRFRASSGADLLVRDYLAALTPLASVRSDPYVAELATHPVWRTGTTPVRPRLKRLARKLKHRIVLSAFPGGQRLS